MPCFDDFRFKDSCCLLPEACRSSAALTVTVTMRLLVLMYSFSSVSDLIYQTSCIIFVILDLFTGLYHVYRTTCQCIKSYGCTITILYIIYIDHHRRHHAVQVTILWPTTTTTLQTTTCAKENMRTMVEDKDHQCKLQRVKNYTATIGVHNAASTCKLA